MDGCLNRLVHGHFTWNFGGLHRLVLPDLRWMIVLSVVSDDWDDFATRLCNPRSNRLLLFALRVNVSLLEDNILVVNEQIVLVLLK